ncbi:MAG: NOP5/NOP56 family protein, partial [Nitrososphaerales archaeon]
KTLSRQIESLVEARDALSSYVENMMEDIATNVSHLAGPMVGARLLARAGGLDRLSRMPSSTIQVLGAEKALFRSLRTGSRPPKHGILFQHQSIHSAPKWQRGKVARSLASKIAIAARIDAHGGGRNVQLEEDLKKRIEEVKNRYKEPPKEAGRFRNGPRDRSFRRNRRHGTPR